MGAGTVVGVVLAVLAAFALAIQYLCVRLGTERGSVRDVVLISLLVNVLLAVPLALVIHGIPGITRWGIVWFAFAGFSGSFLARVCIFKSTELIGASRTAPVVATNAFVASVLAILIFGETVTIAHLIGIVLIVGGVGVISWETARDQSPERSLRDFGVTLILPILAAILLGIEPIFVSLGFEAGAGFMTGVAVNATAATTGFLVYLLVATHPIRSTFRRTAELKWHLAAGVSSFLGIAGIFAGLEVAPVVLVIPLVQIVPLLVLILSALFMPRRLEEVTWRLLLAAILVVLGAILVSIA